MFLLLFGVALNSHAQDSLSTLNAEQVLQLVKRFHPISRQAVIGVEKAKADVTISRGAFNPVISHYIADKTFDGTNYYEQVSPAIKLPTWYGVELSAGTETLTGDRLDESTTKGTTNYVGISVPLAKNLAMDKRRAALRQAKLFHTMAKIDQRAMMNNLLMEAMDAYWHWVSAYQVYVVVKNNVDVNEKRIELVRKSFVNGERPAIDTTEALTQLMSFQYLRNNAWLEFQNAGLQLSAYLWKADYTPFQLPETIVPQSGWENETNISNFNLVLVDLLSVSAKNNPNLLVYDYKLNQLNIDKQLKFQELLPKIDLEYNRLGKDNALTSSGALLNDNYQYGIKFEMPLFLSQGRGAYRNAKLKIEETKLELARKQVSVDLKIKSYFNEYITLKNQIALQSANYNNYKSLLQAEEARFANGESSLFLINSRENKALEAFEKLVELKTKYFKTLYALQWSAGLLE